MKSIRIFNGRDDFLESFFFIKIGTTMLILEKFFICREIGYSSIINLFSVKLKPARPGLPETAALASIWR